jgi:16S rRNA G966 N2-methylase RsmD
MKTIFDSYSQEKIEETLMQIEIWIEDKFKDYEIIKKLNCDHSNELLSIAKARIISETDFSKNIGNLCYFNEEDLRFSTPEIIADYRAKKLKCKKIVDLCSGIGSQTIAFSKYCDSVLAIELDERKVRYSEENFIAFENIRLIAGDVLNPEIIEQVKKFKPDILFCDPERLSTEEERNIYSIKPDIKKLLLVYSKITHNICLEMPPQIDINKLKELGDFEVEYLSFNKKLNRLNLCFGNLKKSNVSVVDVISGIRLEKRLEKLKVEKSSFPLKYVYELGSAVIKSGLENEFILKTRSKILEGFDRNKLLLTSSNEYKGELLELCNFYEFLDTASNFEVLRTKLNSNNIKKVVIKYSINPKEYWRERNKIEKGLKGKNQAVLFQRDNKDKREWIICKEIIVKNINN